MAITDWPTGERPREKLLAHGANSLSDSELLAIFLRIGLPGKSAVDLARDLLQHFGSLRKLLNADKQAFCSQAGLGPAKFVQLQAVLEMARRHIKEEFERGDELTTAEHTRSYLRHVLRDERSEQFGCLFLDTKHRVLQWEVLFKGTIDATAVYPRIVVERALSHNAAAVIAAHNHPSGVAEPSHSDVAITRKLKDALALMDIRMLDHFIVGDSEPVSMAELGMV